MRMHRVLTLLVAMALGLMLPATLSSPAGAAVKPKREITIVGSEPRPDVFKIRGRVEGQFQKLPVIVQRQNCKKCRWVKFRKTTANSKGRYASRVQALRKTGTVCYRVKTLRTKEYRASTSTRVCIVTRRF